LAAGQIGREARQPMKLIVRPALLDHHVLAFYEPRLVQTLAERHHDIRERLSRCAAEKSDHRHPLERLGGPQVDD
jgi:hypothetical protein